MGLITVEGLGVIEIKGDWPTAEEDLKIQRLLAKRKQEPTPEPMPEAPPTAEQMEAAGFGDLAETMRGFQQYEEPPGPVEQLGRAVVGRASQFARSAVEAPIAWAAAETGPATEENLRSLLAEEGFDWDRWKAYVDEAATGTDARKSREAEFAKAFPIMSGVGLSKPASLLAQAAIEPHLEAWREWESEVYEPSEPDMYEALDALTKGNAAPFAQFLGEGIVGSVPGIAAALISSPLVVASYVNDIARSRAENDNRPIERRDIIAAVPAAVGIAGMEKVGIGSFSRGVGRGFVGEGVTEGAQETLQAATEEVGTEKGFDLAETLKSRTAPAAVVGGFTGGVAGIPSSALSRRQTPTDTTPTALPEAAPIVEEVVETDVVPTAPTEAVVEGVATEEDVSEAILEALSVAQLGAPESAMIDVQELGVSSGLYDHQLEHVGDIIHRMSEPIGSGFGASRAKVNAAIVALRNPLSFEREVLEQVASNAKGSGVDYNDALSTLRSAGQAYADAHRKLVPLNETQDTARRASIALGEWRFRDALVELNRLKRVIDEGEDVWRARVKAVDPERASLAYDQTHRFLQSRAASRSRFVRERAQRLLRALTTPAETVDTPGPTYQRSELERAVDAAIDLEDGAADTRRRVAESERRVRASVPTRPGVEAEPRRKTSFENQADSDQSMADAVRLAVSPDAPISEVAGAVARAVGGEAQAKAGIRDARAAKNEDTVAFLEELGNSPEQIAAIMAREPVSYAQARASLVDSGMLTSIQDGRVVVPGSVQTLANDVVFRGKLPDATETLALLHSMVMTKRAYKRAIANAAQIDPNDSGALEAANKDLSTLLKEAEHYAKANTLGGSAVGRALRYRRFRVNEGMDLVEAITLAAIRNKAPLSEDQRQVIKDIFTKADADIKAASAKRVRLFEKLKEARKDLRKAERDGVKKAIASARRRVDDLEGGILEADMSIRAAKAEKEISPDVGSRSRARRRFVDPAMELADMSRALKSTLDDSALMRQGRELFFKSLFDLDNQAGLRTIGPALRMLTTGRRGRAYARRLQEGILKRDMQAASEYAGLELAEIEGAGDSKSFDVDSREEKFQTNVFEKGPFRRWLGKHIVYPSQNAYSYTLNALRVWYFDKKVKEIASKIDPSLGPNPTAKQVMEVVPKTDLEFVANYINSSTGRGKWKLSNNMVKNADGSFDPITGAARTFLYAPRYTLSRFEHALKVPMLATLPAAKKMAPALAGVGPYGKLSDAARGSMAKAAYGELGFGLGLGALAAIAAATTSGDEPDDALWDKFLNPGSADFGKVVVGDDMHLDFTGGIGPTWRHVLAQIYTMDEGPRLFEFDSRRIGQLIRNKMHPFWSQLYAIATNEDYLGRPMTEADWEWTLDDMDEKATHMLERFALPAAGAFTPIMLESGYEHFAGEETGPLDGAELLKRAGGAAGEFLGTGVSRYVPDEGRYGATGRRKRGYSHPKYGR